MREETQHFKFSDLRTDWYASNYTLPRVVRSCIEGKRHLEFHGFPRQWIPVFEWFGIKWRDSVDPQEYIPFFSDLTEDSIVATVRRAIEQKSLRILVESATMYDPILSDFLYILDNSVRIRSPAMESEFREVAEGTGGRKRRLILNGWQSYGRPSVREIESLALSIEPKFDMAVALPCSLTRPYGRSKIHKRIYRILEENGYDPEDLHKIVITSLGVLPEELWEIPQVMTYDAGVPDIYRTLRLVRQFFTRARYWCLLDCLQFEPYSDVLRIAQREGIIQEIRRIRVLGRKHFFIRP